MTTEDSASTTAPRFVAPAAVGMVTAVIAWYASFAGVTNATWKRTVIPTWPLAR